MTDPIDDQAQRGRLVLLTRHGINPSDVLADAEVEVRGLRLHYEAVVCNPDGTAHVSDRRMLVERRSVPYVRLSDTVAPGIEPQVHGRYFRN